MRNVGLVVVGFLAALAVVFGATRILPPVAAESLSAVAPRAASPLLPSPAAGQDDAVRLVPDTRMQMQFSFAPVVRATAQS